MWIKQAAFIILLISRLAMSLFALDILAWTFGLTILPPLDALLRFGIWSVPSLLPYFWPSLAEYLRGPIVTFLESANEELPVWIEKIRSLRMEVAE